MKFLFLSLLLLLAQGSHARADGNADAREILVRFSTERLSPAQKFEVIQEILAEHDLKNRVQVYAVLVKELPGLGLGQENVESLFRGGLEDIKKVPLKMFRSGESCASATEALGCFAHEGLRFALSNRVMSPELCHEFMVAVLKAPWFDLSLSQHVAWLLSEFSDRKLPYPYYREAHELLLAHPSYHEYTAEKVVMGLIKPPLCHSPTCGLTEDFVPSWKDKHWLLEKVLASGKVNPKQASHLMAFQKQFALGIVFEDRATGSVSADAKILLELAARAENAPYLADIVTGWLAKNPVPENTLAALVEALLQSYERMPVASLYLPSQHTTSGAFYALLGLLLHYELPEASQERVFSFFFRKTAEGDRKHHIRYLAMALPFEPKGLKVRVLGLQKPLELFAANSPKSDSDSDFIGDEGLRRSSWIGTLLRLVQSCQRPALNWNTRAAVCNSITDERAIYKAIAANPNVFPAQREQANKLAQGLPLN